MVSNFPSWSGPLITHMLSGMGGVAVGMSKSVVDWFKERARRKELEDALYREFCRNLRHLMRYQGAISDNPNYAREYPEIAEWLRRDVYDHALREQPVALTKMRGGALIGEAYMMMGRLALKQDIRERHAAAYRLQTHLQSPSLEINPKMTRMMQREFLAPQAFAKVAIWEYRYKPLAWFFRWCGRRMMRNNPMREGVQYDPYFGFFKSLRTGMYGRPVVYKPSGEPMRLD